MPRSSSAAKVQEWVERLERLQSSGLTAAKFCEAEGVSLPSFYQWKRKLTAPANPAQDSTRGPSAFTAIELRPSAPAMTTIRLPGGVAIEFSGNPRMLELWLQKLLEQALKSGSSPC
jgi:transposase